MQRQSPSLWIKDKAAPYQPGERDLGTNPRDPDSDDDGLSDGLEGEES